MQLGSTLAQRKAEGRKLLVGYVTAGLYDGWQDVARALVDGGVDAVEIGIPFSDPVMDGPVIQEASNRALARGVTPASVLSELEGNTIGAPLAVMTYFNLVHRFGASAFAGACQRAGVTGAILPDLSLEVSAEWRNAARPSGIDTVFLVAPNSTDARLKVVTEAAEGFVYAVGSLGVTGAREQLADSARLIGDRARAVTDKPVLIGVGISTPEQAAEAVQHADGVVIGTTVVKAMLDGAGVKEMTDLAKGFRRSID